MSWHTKTIKQISDALKAKQISSKELADYFLQRIANAKDLNAVIDLNEAKTIEQANHADTLIAKGAASPLIGVPILHKDVFVTKHWKSTACSKILGDYVSPFDAHVVAKLGPDGAGMVCLGKANMDEFAMGSSNENSYVGPALNPWDKTRVPGGSSGGSAVAIAAGLSPAATGTDTGGSIRQPASLCGITGIKPTYGRVSRYGMIAYASSLDQGGPMAKTAEDCAILLNAMAGHDHKDSTSLDRPSEDYTAKLGKSWTPGEAQLLKGLKVGLPKEYFGDGLSSDVRAAVEGALEQFKKMGAECVPVSLPKTELSIPVYYVIAPAEASSNLSRFDGVRYGRRADQYGDLLDMYKRTRSEGFGTEVKRRIMIGTYVLSHGYYDAYYLKAQRIRRIIAQDFQEAFKQCDIIAGPVAPTVAGKIGEKTSDPTQMYLEDIYTLSPNLAGLPAMSAPCGFGDNGMPVGIQLIGNYFSEASLLQLAHAYQMETDWHQRLSPAAQKGGAA
ncbi:Asp-tRNA(Asn)/Glu-tRNA(Gln) amidotransferase subunit GatA [Polynucleobacter sp. MWH-Spelu-300-X4]|uniref:Asp-tRNA(Asn)/Glu-tRNA(Gln) amidotransferase subunit GatA n=1 Tax=Polynucleobacter sp. MWH-Spelu-300-X4 TaxID=2689109 RepID=UPI001BFE2FA9|nr:Asp-tRNA(Asn)/Glu-tRNA(Gln) amidotransferase subunit GatA [Polynucleobacter sp. MWH-Spelu-300-X4]QWD79728.1 Asp-tRNA(Asn)/Glu-tRNA(Gln) amidotransferase subunit GatA [Polynucleobacter sp. MWH-Spelu-300-X4]